MTTYESENNDIIKYFFNRAIRADLSQAAGFNYTEPQELLLISLYLNHIKSRNAWQIDWKLLGVDTSKKEQEKIWDTLSEERGEKPRRKSWPADMSKLEEVPQGLEIPEGLTNREAVLWVYEQTGKVVHRSNITKKKKVKVNSDSIQLSVDTLIASVTTREEKKALYDYMAKKSATYFSNVFSQNKRLKIPEDLFETISKLENHIKNLGHTAHAYKDEYSMFALSCLGWVPHMFIEEFNDDGEIKKFHLSQEVSVLSNADVNTILYRKARAEIKRFANQSYNKRILLENGSILGVTPATLRKYLQQWLEPNRDFIKQKLTNYLKPYHTYNDGILQWSLPLICLDIYHQEGIMINPLTITKIPLPEPLDYV
jgi:hypothetical protein